jgi:hypothetical protein
VKLDSLMYHCGHPEFLCPHELRNVVKDIIGGPTEIVNNQVVVALLVLNIQGGIIVGMWTIYDGAHYVSLLVSA